MILTADDLKQLSPSTLNNLIIEYLVMQLEDGRLEDYTENAYQQGVDHVRALLNQGTLVVEYSEHHESIAIKQASEKL
jgi:uncharacterized protein YheU (UPF0270 family)